VQARSNVVIGNFVPLYLFPLIVLHSNYLDFPLNPRNLRLTKYDLVHLFPCSGSHRYDPPPFLLSPEYPPPFPLILSLGYLLLPWHSSKLTFGMWGAAPPIFYYPISSTFTSIQSEIVEKDLIDSIPHCPTPPPQKLHQWYFPPHISFFLIY